MNYICVEEMDENKGELAKEDRARFQAQGAGNIRLGAKYGNPHCLITQSSDHR